MKKILALVLALCMVFALCACGSSESSGSASAPAASGLPVKDGDTIKVICPYGAGGTADAIARKWGEVATKLTPYTFIVENMTGGDGFLANTEYASYDVNTSDLLVHGLGVIYRHDNGKEFGIEEVDFDRSEIQPVAMVDSRTWILYAAPNTSVADILDMAKAGTLKMSGGNPLSDPHLALGSLVALVGGTVTPVPYEGGAEQIQALIKGEVNCFVGSTQAGQEYVDAGDIVPVLAFGNRAFEGFTVGGKPISVPSIVGDAKCADLPADVDFSGSMLLGGGYIATRTGASQEWVDLLIEISKAVWADEDFAGWIDSILLNREAVYGQDAIDQANTAAAVARNAYVTLSGN